MREKFLASRFIPEWPQKKGENSITIRYKDEILANRGGHHEDYRHKSPVIMKK
jgi:hypothetical protein